MSRIGAHEAVRTMIEAIGDDPFREGLRETPSRVVKSWEELFSGYRYEQEPEALVALFKTFGDAQTDQMVVVKDIDLFSTCEHHLLPFIGQCHIGYIPNGKVLGLSKFARVVDAFSRRLQVQERLTEQIAGAIQKYLEPKGVGVVIHAKHLCMGCRGVKRQNAVMVTSALRGTFAEEVDCRAEFMNLIPRS